MFSEMFDVCEAHYLFARHYHEGGDTSDRIFARLNRMGFKPSLTLKSNDYPQKALTPEGVEKYYRLVLTHPDSPYSQFSPRCFDDPDFFDRYTVEYAPGVWFSMSENPTHPQGFGQHGDVSEAWAAENPNKIDFFDLPPKCQQAIMDLMTD